MPDLDKLQNLKGKKTLNMNFDAGGWNIGENIGSLYQTWFVPPTNGRYRFYMTCDDKCKIKIAPCPDKTSPLTTLLTHLTEDVYRDYWSSKNFITGADHRAYWSEWVELKKGENYYLEGRYASGKGGDHFSVAVEIEQTAIKNHHHSMREI